MPLGAKLGSYVAYMSVFVCPNRKLFHSEDKRSILPNCTETFMGKHQCLEFSTGFSTKYILPLNYGPDYRVASSQLVSLILLS